MINDHEKIELFKLMAKATGAGEDFSFETLDVLVLIAQGMFWSKELDQNARHLSRRCTEAFMNQGQD